MHRRIALESRLFIPFLGKISYDARMCIAWRWHREVDLDDPMISFYLSTFFHYAACRHHMEPEWAAVELWDCIKEELSPERGAGELKQRSSQMMLDAIRVLPAPVAGDLFVTCAARGHIGVVLFYFQEGDEHHVFRVKGFVSGVDNFLFLPENNRAL